MAQNNFNSLRLLFAVFVVISHCYPLSGATTGDYLNRLTNGQVSFSFIGLSGFFIISGYLCFQSLEKSHTLVSYFWKRIRRIYPGLIVMLLMTVLLCGVVYEGSLADYYSSKSVWTYLRSNLLLVKQQLEIGGVFTHNPYNPAINGSLWSLLYEVSFYVGLAVLFFFNKPVQICLTTSVLIVLTIARFYFTERLNTFNFILVGRLVAEFAPFFFFGCLYGILGIGRMKRPLLVSLLLSLILIVVLYLGVFDYSKSFILPPLILLTGLNCLKPVALLVDKFGDISYGIYIYSFPIQQTLVHYFHWNALELMLPSIALAALAGYASWHLVEKRALAR